MDARAALVLWLEHLEQERRLSPRTLAAYGFIGRRYLTFLEGHRGGPLAAGDLGQVSAADIRAWLAVLRQFLRKAKVPSSSHLMRLRQSRIVFPASTSRVKFSR